MYVAGFDTVPISMCRGGGMRSTECSLVIAAAAEMHFDITVCQNLTFDNLYSPVSE